MLQGYLRADGRKGVRNVLVVAYLVECAHHVAREITLPFREQGVHLIGFPGCYPNAYALGMMEKLCTHPNVGGALLVSLGCEGFDKRRLARTIEASGRPVLTIGIQDDRRHAQRPSPPAAIGSTGRCPIIARQQPVPMGIDELTVGTICGGSDATSGLTANPAMGVAFDLLVADGAKTIFEETGELIGMEHLMAARAANPAARRRIEALGGKGGAVLRDARLCELRAGQRRRRPDDDRGEVAGRVREIRPIDDRRHRQTRHRAAQEGPLPPRCRPRRRSALRLSQHQRQRRDRRAHRVRLAGDPLLDRPRVGRRLRDRARDQGLRES